MWKYQIISKINLINIECELVPEILMSGWTWKDPSFLAGYLYFSVWLNY